MTVSELIEKLKEMPNQEAKILRWDEHHVCTEHGAFLEVERISNGDQFHEEKLVGTVLIE